MERLRGLYEKAVAQWGTDKPGQLCVVLHISTHLLSSPTTPPHSPSLPPSLSISPSLSLSPQICGVTTSLVRHSHWVEMPLE